MELIAVGVQVFRDEDQLSTGDQLSERLEGAIADADIFILIATAEGLASS